jgi:hypothetical protein
MLSAIGSPSTPGIAPLPGSSTAGIEAQLNRYKKELADCVSCASASTPEGKAAIAAAASKVSNAEARIEKIAASNPGSPAASVQSAPPTSSQTSPTGSNKNGPAGASATANASSTRANDSSAKTSEAALTYERPAAIDPGSGMKLSDTAAGMLVSVFA